MDDECAGLAKSRDPFWWAQVLGFGVTRSIVHRGFPSAPFLEAPYRPYTPGVT